MQNKATMMVVETCILFLGVACHSTAAPTVLPTGGDYAPIEDRYFPNRLHAFVWRNWGLVKTAKLAEVLDTSPENVEEIARSMGLPTAVEVPKQMTSRGYITLIRRNWHLLPYEQLLTLVEMTPDQLATTLREDDFLWVKLGLLKPKCEPLHYTKPDEAARRRASEIKHLVEEEFGDALQQPGEPRFSFVEHLSRPLDDRRPADALHQSGSNRPLSLRYIYSYHAVYGDPLLNPELDPYPDGLLDRLSRLGVNGVWLHVVLRDLSPGTETFPEFGQNHEARLKNLRLLVDRAKKYGIGVYLYINEPRSMPNGFFDVNGRKDMAGVNEGDFTALCTSNPKVRAWMRDSLAYVFRQIPDLAGVFTISASENLVNCASHGKWKSCPHCKQREYADIIAEANATIEEGVHLGNPEAKVLVWDWAWHDHGDSPDIIAQLPKSTWLVSISEWGLPLNRGGIPSTVNEYSMSAVGPGPRAKREWAWAREAGLKTIAKVQLNSTWELSTVPYLPVMDLVAEHCHRLASAGVDGMMLSWTMGGYPSPNLEIAARFSSSDSRLPSGEARTDHAPSKLKSGETSNPSTIPSVDEVLDAVALERYGPEGAPLARKAWTAFSAAFREYPFEGGRVLYRCPVHVGPANPLYAEKTGYEATMVGIPYDNLSLWLGPYPVNVFIDQFEKVAAAWQSGIPLLKAAVEKAPPDRRAEVQADLRFAQVAGIHFQSVANQTRFIAARDVLANTSGAVSPEERRRLQEEIERSVKSEIALARELFTLANEDSRIGFEASNQYVYVPLDLVEKVINCRWLQDRYHAASAHY